MKEELGKIALELKILNDTLCRLSVQFDCSSRQAKKGQDAANQIAIASEAFQPVCDQFAYSLSRKMAKNPLLKDYERLLKFEIAELMPAMMPELMEKAKSTS